MTLMMSLRPLVENSRPVVTALREEHGPQGLVPIPRRLRHQGPGSGG